MQAVEEGDDVEIRLRVILGGRDLEVGIGRDPFFLRIGYSAAALELFDDTVERRKPVAHQIVVVAGAEEACHRTEEATRLLAPGHPGTRLELRLDLFPVFEHCHHHIERADHGDRAVLNRKDHGLLRRQGEFLRCRVIGYIV